MGSIGQYPGVLDYIENAYIRNVTMLNAENGARLKSWAGEDVGYGIVPILRALIPCETLANPGAQRS